MRPSAEMPYHIGLKIKLYPSDKQKRIIAVNDGAKRAVYNHMVACSNEIYFLKKSSQSVPVYTERVDFLRFVSRNAKNIKNALPHLYGEDVDDQTIANTILNYRHAWKNQKELHTGVPTFKKKSYEQSYQTNAHYYFDKNGKLTSNVRFEDSRHVTLPKLGRIRFGGSPKLVASLMDRDCETRIGTICISRDPVGEYWASFQIASEEPFYEPFSKTGAKQGIDLNLIDLVNDSDGEASENRKYYATAQKALAKSQHKQSRMAEHAKAEGRRLSGSSNYQKQRRKTAYLHRKVERQRTNYLHNLSKEKVKNQDFIAAEDLKVRNMIKNHHLAKAIADASWRKFLTMLQYKGDLYGKTVVLVPPENTTQTCSCCGYVMKGAEHLTLDIREWECPNCHTFHKRDTNAAKNILNRGLQAATEIGLIQI